MWHWATSTSTQTWLTKRDNANTDNPIWQFQFCSWTKKARKKNNIFPINNFTQSLKAIINVIKSGVLFAIRRWTHLLWSTILMAYNKKRKLYTQSQHCINNITQESIKKEKKENNKSNFSCAKHQWSTQKEEKDCKSKVLRTKPNIYCSST
jgi:hypothetical protein